MNIVFVPRYYRMNPKTEDLFTDGKGLVNGMVILVENPDSRAIIKSTEMEDWEYDRALVLNRWCTVSELNVVGGALIFVGVYEDGVKIKRNMSLYDSWLVKKDSLPDDFAEKMKKARVEKVVQQIATDALRIAVTKDIIAEAMVDGVSEDTAEITGGKLDLMVEKYVRRLLREF